MPEGAGRGTPGTETAVPPVFWVFDVISPFAYLAFPRVRALLPPSGPTYVPVLFAALLNHFGQRGPAELPSKRRFTYRFALWRARRLGLPMRMPPAHPFNPLAALRLIIAAGSEARAVGTVLEAVWREGRDVSDPQVIAELAQVLGVSDPQGACGATSVKQRLRENTDWAIARGVFGVPTLLIGEELFWGHDAVDMAQEYLSHPERFGDPLMQAADRLPIGATRI